MKFAILTINYGRPQIFHLFCSGIKRLRAQLNMDFPVVCVSGAEDKIICDKYNITHIEYPNYPVSDKWNAGCEYIRTLDIDYVIISGSDNIFSLEALSAIVREMNNDIDLIGFNRMFFYDTDGINRGQLLIVTTKGIFGVGRAIHRRVLDAVNWHPWNYPIQRSWGMDSILYKNISPHVKTKSIVDGIIVDCKSKDNLNKFTMLKNNYHGKPCDSSLFLNFLSKEELDILRSINKVGLPLSFPRVRHKRGRTLI